MRLNAVEAAEQAGWVRYDGSNSITSNRHAAVTSLPKEPDPQVTREQTMSSYAALTTQEVGSDRCSSTCFDELSPIDLESPREIAHEDRL
jgi:hypothetical protein